MLPLPSSPVPVAVAAVLIGLAAARVLRNGPRPGATWWRQAAVHALPAIATATVAVVVWTTPVAVWARAAAGTLGVAVVSAPFVNGLRVPHRPPTRAEEIALERVPGDPREDVHVVDTCGRITGYAAGNPLTGTVAVSAGALAALPPQAVAALVAHERAHLERHHALFRAGTSAAVLAAGIGFLAATLSGGTAIGIGVVAILAGERLLAAATARRTEFAADAAAARRRSPAAVIALLSSLPTRSDERSLPRRLRSTHPSPGRRIAAIREQFDADGPHTPRSTNRRIYPAVGSIRGVNREGLAYGLLFAVPPAIGMTGFSVMATGGGLINPLAGLIGAATFGVIFAFVYVAAARGEANEDRSPGTI